MIFISKEKEQQIIDYYINNKTNFCEITRKFEIGRESVRNILNKNNIKRQKRNKIKVNFEEKELIDYYNIGNGIATCGCKFGVCHSTVRDILSRNNIKIRNYKESLVVSKVVRFKYKIDESFFDNPDTWEEKQAWVLGWFASDGCNLSSKNTCFIQLQERDKVILDTIRSLLQHEGPLHFLNDSKDNPNHSDSWILRITSKKISQALFELGIVDKKSLIYEFPKFLRPDLVRHYIRGYFEGDGYIGNTKKIQYDYSSVQIGTKIFLEEFSKQLNTQAGIKIVKVRLRLQDKDHKWYNGITSEYKIVRKEDLYKFYNYLYQDSKYFLPRKKQKFDELVNFMINSPKYNYLNPKLI